MDWFWLKFASGRLEEAYETAAIVSAASDAFRDLWLAALIATRAALCAGLLHFSSSIDQSLPKDHLPPSSTSSCVWQFCCWPVHLFFLWISLQVAFTGAPVREGSGSGSGSESGRRLCRLFFRLRKPAVALARILHALEVAIGGAAFLALFKLDDAPSGFYTSPAMPALVLSILTHLAITLGQPLKFMYHFWLHIPVSAFMVFYLGRDSCSHVANQLDDTAMKTFDQWIVSKLDKAVRWLLSVMFPPMLQPSLQWNAGQSCLQLSLFVQVFVGYGVLCYVVWWLERRNRVAFVRSLPIAVRDGEDVQTLSTFHQIVHVVYAVLVFAVLWRHLAEYTGHGVPHFEETATDFPVD